MDSSNLGMTSYMGTCLGHTNLELDLELDLLFLLTGNMLAIWETRSPHQDDRFLRKVHRNAFVDISFA